MTQKAMFFESQMAALLCANLIDRDEDFDTESDDSDPDWGAAWSEDQYAAQDPGELEVFDFEEVKSELGVHY